MNDLVLRPQRVLSLCSGAGGLDLGVHDALGGCAQSICYVEHETTAAEVLAARIEDGALDDAPIWGDLHAFDARGWRGKVDGIIGGYPCQPFSVAGKRLGVNDPRHLWPSIARIIAECEPGWCFFENVAGHLRLGYWDVVRPDLERLGYRVTQGLFTAAEVGAPHQRERLFILAHRTSGGTGGGDGSTRETGRGARSDERSAELAHAAIGGQRERGEPSNRDRQPDGGHGPVGDAERERGRLPPPGEVTGQQATGTTIPSFPPGPGERAAWRRILAERPDLAPATESSVRGVADGLDAGMDLSRTARLRLTGNGVVPAQAALAFRTLWGQLAHSESPGREARGAVGGGGEQDGTGTLALRGELADAGYAECEDWRDEG